MAAKQASLPDRPVLRGFALGQTAVDAETQQPNFRRHVIGKFQAVRVVPLR
jgi:hypothetical protein